MTRDAQGGYSVEPAPTSSPPMRPMPPRSPFANAGPPPDLATQDVPCLNFGYNLRGLSATSTCPECGAPVQRSLQGNLLEFSSFEYVGNLSRGLLFILIAVIASIVISVGGVAVALALLASGKFGPNAASSDIDLIASVCMLPISALLLYGWWLFSAPDPAILGNEQGQTPRIIIRVTVIVMAAATVIVLMVNVAMRGNPSVQLAAGGAGLFSGVARIAQFFAALLYVRWLAPRIPDQQIYLKANTYLWLLPLIYVVGMCVLVGPLVATIMYFLLLNNVRVRLAEIRARQTGELDDPRAA